jgi:hypothetical protein
MFKDIVLSSTLKIKELSEKPDAFTDSQTLLD